MILIASKENSMHICITINFRIMKILMTAFLSLLIKVVFSQTDNFDELLVNGKAEFNKDFDQQDYQVAIDNLEKAVKLKPGNAEAHYFLGYAYSRLNAKDGKGMFQMNLALTMKCSEELETVNKLQPKYTGESLILDTYSKLSSEWGSQAMSYWHNSKPDSAIWAFKEGKKRGGFGEFFLSVNRAVLDLCSQDAILVSSGDNFTIPLWYLQIAEGYRKDVVVIDISLLNTTWYPALLSTRRIVPFDLPQAVLDTVEYCMWHDSTITIKNFSWTMKPSYYEHYILRGDRVFLSMLKGNNFKKDVYFTTGFIEDNRLSLKDYLLSKILVDKLNIDNQTELDNTQFNTELTTILKLIKNVNFNSQQEVNFIDLIRYNVFVRISKAPENKEQMKELFKLLDKYADEKTYPYQTDDLKKYADKIREQL
jgi:hypothetical protein